MNKYYELSAPQKAIWFTEQYYKNTNVNNVCGTFFSNENLNFDLFKKAINIFLQNNDSFKIKLHLIDGEIKQYFSEISNINFEIVNVKTTEDQTALEEKIASEVFNLQDSLLFKIVLFKYPDNHGGFIINSHHIISDSWTNGLVANDIALIYDKLKKNETYSKDENLSYKTYLQSEKDYINSTKFEKDKEYWNNVFSTIPEIATIPSIKDSSANIDDITAKRLLLNVDNNLLSHLKKYCEENKISMYNFFMSVFALYLSRVSGLDEFVIGTPILNRSNFKEKQTTGMFINTLPLKISLKNNDTFLNNLKEIAINSLALLRHQKYSFQYILEDLRKKDSSIPKLYDILYSYQITKMNENEDSLNHSTSWTFNKTTVDDLDIHMYEWNENNSIKIAYDYKLNKYNEQDILNIHARILHIIKQILENKNILLENIEIVTPEEKKKILFEFNNTKVDYLQDKTIVDLFEEQAEKNPNNIAVIFKDQKLTYKELNEKSNSLAKEISDRKISNKNICIILDKSIQMVISMLGILKSGNCYVPIDSKYPDSRIELIIKETDCSLIVTNNFYKNKYNKDIILIENISSYVENINYSMLHKNAYIIFTSGTTGIPKGVEILNKNIINTLLWRKNYYKFDSSIKNLQLPSFSFDSSVEDIFTSLISGGTLVIPSNNINDVKSLIDDIKKYNISSLLITPALYNILLDQDCSNINSLKFITIAGESFNIDLIKKHFNVFPNVKLFNEYGPTENSVCSTVYEFTKDSDKILIGKPISNSKAYIVSSDSLCPIGVPGELWVGGNGVAKGYLNNENLTNKKFIKNPFDSGMLYKTGDLARWTNDGNIEFIDRIDNQIKIRGFRIELNEIDTNILNFPDINQSVTILNKINGIKNLCSYITSNSNINIKNLKQFLVQKLPNYMVPTYITQIEKLPLNINGKIDKKQLSELNFAKNNRKVLPARNKIDNIIIKFLEEKSLIKNISIDDNFLDIGIDSLSAINLSIFLSNKLKINITVKDIFEYSSIESLSDYISTLKGTTNSINNIAKTSPKEYYPISSAQKRIYYSSLKDNNSLLYNTAGGIILDKALDKEKLEKCFKKLIIRHSSLRTHFENREDMVVQIIENNVEYKLDYEESDIDDINIIYSNFVKPFDLTKTPLFRTKLVKLKNNKELLLLDMHHIISDGTSLNILMEELCNLYNNKELSNKEIEYKDFAIWENQNLNSKDANSAKEFWVEQFRDDIPLLNMPTVYSRPNVQSFEGSNYFETLNGNIYNNILQTAKALNITPYMLMLSVYYITLSKYTSQDDIVVGTPVIGRELPELSNLIGMFVNSLPIRAKIDNSISFKEFSKEIKRICTNDFMHGSYPFDMLVNNLNIKRDVSRNPLFDTMFIYQSESYPTISFDGIKSEYFIPNNPISKFDLSLEIVPIDSEYKLRFEYCKKLFDEPFIKRFSSHYINILNTVLENSSIKLFDIDMLSEEEKNQILYNFNDTKADYPSNKTIINLFEEQVEKTPSKVAVVFENKKLTYKELNEKSNELARFLLANGADTGDVIGILLDKSIEMIISILGILKIGGTFLPIDVNYPNERIDYILKDSKSNILLTTSDLVHKSNDTVQVLYVEENNSYFDQYDNNNLNIKYDVDNIAYIMYTSGSTGNPKGVMVTNKNIVRLVKNTNYIKFDKDENILQTGSIVFDACTFEIWGALLNGFKLFIMKKENLLDAYKLKEYLFTNNITTLWLTAPLFNQLCETDANMFKNVRKLLTGGDVLSPKHINMVRKACPDLTVINGYGPTENTTFSCCFTIDKDYFSPIPIGKPISNSTAYVVSSSGKLCPIGVPGELWVGGDGVSKGYLNNKELTDKTFIPNPFSNGIIYKTGDLVKWLPDGNIEFIGRIDNQVKVRGFRIELNEINKRILENSFIKESFTTIKTVDDNKFVYSYIVPSKDLDINELKNYLNRYLPNYMIPTYFIKMKKLPINQNGKVDKNALPVNFEKKIITIKKEKPTSKEEEILLGFYKKVLNNEDIGITDNFFDLGGDSLTAMKVQIEAISHNINITYSDIFNYPTVKELAHSINLSKKHYKSSLQDFSKYDKLLKNNTLDKNITYESAPIGNILITGVTGFLGIHVLDSFLKKEKGKAYCIIREKNGMNAKDRLYNVLHFYYGTKYDDLVGNRIIPIDGDFTVDNFGLTPNNYDELGKNISTIIHSAALVKHYGVYSDFEKANIVGTQKMVNFAKKFNSKLIYISTISVSGNSLAEVSNIDSNFDQEKNFDETSFYIGQNLDNLYVRSKFEAEKVVLDNIEDGLSACILRMGNLTSRYSEGMFQQNHFENAFVNRLKSFIQIGAFPKELLNVCCEFSPVDYCGDAIIDIASHFSNKYTVYHLLNDKYVSFDNLLKMIKELGINIKIVSNSEFSDIIKEIINNPEKKHYISGIINDLTKDKKLEYKSNIKVESNFTKEFLHKTGFEWPNIDINYIRKYFKYLIDIGYLDIKLN